MRKHRGVKTLQQVASVFGETPAVVELCEGILEDLQEDDSSKMAATTSLVDGMVMDFSLVSPTAVATRMLQEPNIPENRAAPVLTGSTSITTTTSTKTDL